MGYTGAFGYLPDLADRRDKTFSNEIKRWQQKAKDPQQAVGQVAAAKGKRRRGQRQDDQPVPITEVWQGWDRSATKAKELHDKAHAAHKAVPPGHPGNGNSNPMDARVAARYRAALGRAFDGESRPVIRPGPPDGPEQPPNKPPRVDLRPFMSPVENQGPLMSCTANAVMGLIDYLQIATTGTYLDGSRLFLYKATRDLLHLAGDSGAYVRSALKALALFGSCPEDYYPYYPPAFHQEPDAFCYSLAARFRGIAYYRLQGRVAELRASIAQGFPCASGSRATSPWTTRTWRKRESSPTRSPTSA
jgi:hypothetical protein